MTVQQVSLRNDWLTQTADDSCGEGCAQLDDFNWFLPADERAGDLLAPESEMEVSDRESEVEYIEPDSTPLQMKTTAKQLLCPPVVAQTRPMEGCNPASPRRLRRGRDVLTEDGAVAVDTRQVSAALDTVVSREIPAIPVKAPTRKSAPGRVNGKNPPKCAHGPVFCTSEVTHAGSVPNNPPMGQLLGETMVSITCVINTLTGTWRSSEGATCYFPKYCCVK